MGFFFIFCLNIFSQNPKLVDSLEAVYASGLYKEQDELKILYGLAVGHIDPEKKLIFSDKLIETARSLDSINYLIKGLIYKGYAFKYKGDLTESMDNFMQAGKIAEDEKSNRTLGMIKNVIGDVYSLMGDHKNALHYYQNSVALLREEKDSSSVATALYNTGNTYFVIKKYDSAMAYFNESNLIFKNLDHLIGATYNLGSIGMVYAKQGKYALAKKDIKQAISIFKKEGRYTPIPEYMLSMSDIYTTQNNFKMAFSYAHESLELAQKLGQKQEIREANLKLAELYKQEGLPEEALKYYESYNVYRDSVKNLESVQQMANLQTNYEVAQKQTEVDLLEKESEIQLLKAKRQRNLNYASVITAVFIMILAIGVYRRYSFTKKMNLIIEEEKNRSDNLLLNILPEETALELKQKGKVKARKFDCVTVLFTDFQGFTKFSQNLTPEKLVESVDFYYSKFDEIMDKYNLEKIKTLGDSYMCAGGLHHHATCHAIKMVQAAFEITEFVKESKKNNKDGQTRFDIRIGINSGPVVAGIVGTKKFAYDIWGDTVNVASRMEFASESGKINISENTHELIKDHCDCAYRGEMFVKNKGMMKMYFVNGLIV